MKEQNNDKLIKIEDSPLIEESKDFNKNAPIKNIANDTATAAKELMDIDVSSLPTDDAKKLYNAIAEQQDFNVIGKLSKDYFKKYNRNKQFRKELSEMQK